MFTFSFGSAFAESIDYENATATIAQKTAIDKAIDYMYSTFETKVYDKAVADGITVATDAVTISAASFAAVKAEALAEVKEAIKADAKAYSFNDTANLGDMDTAVLANVIFKSKEYYTATAFKTYLATAYDGGTQTARKFELSAAKEEVKATYDAAVKMLGLVNYDAYSTTTPSADKSYQKDAKKAVEDKLTDLYSKYVALNGTYAPAALTSMATCKTAIEANDTAADLGLTAEVYAGTTVATGYYLVTGIKTIANEEASAPTDAANEAVVKANVAATVATFTKDHGTETGASAAAKAYTEMYNYLAKSYVGKTLPTLDFTDSAIQVGNTAAKTTTVTNAYKDVTDLEALAAKLKAEKDAKGNLVRDAKEIDKILAAAIR